LSIRADIITVEEQLASDLREKPGLRVTENERLKVLRRTCVVWRIGYRAPE
jgi:hypothetical protein